MRGHLRQRIGRLRGANVESSARRGRTKRGNAKSPYRRAAMLCRERAARRTAPAGALVNDENWRIVLWLVGRHSSGSRIHCNLRSCSRTRPSRYKADGWPSAAVKTRSEIFSKCSRNVARLCAPRCFVCACRSSLQLDAIRAVEPSRHRYGPRRHPLETCADCDTRARAARRSLCDSLRCHAHSPVRSRSSQVTGSSRCRGTMRGTEALRQAQAHECADPSPVEARAAR